MELLHWGSYFFNDLLVTISLRLSLIVGLHFKRILGFYIATLLPLLNILFETIFVNILRRELNVIVSRLLTAVSVLFTILNIFRAQDVVCGAA